MKSTRHKDRIGDRIAFKLVFYLVFFSSVLTVVATAAQVYFDYTDDLREVTASVHAVVKHQVPEVRRSVLAKDSESINSLLKRILQNSGLAYAAVVVDEKTTWQQGEKVAGKSICTSFPLEESDTLSSQKGFLEVIADIGPVQDRLNMRFIQMLIANGIKIFLIAGFVFLMFQFLVTRHLESLADQIKTLDLSKPYSPLSLKKVGEGKHHELDQVVSCFNDMQMKAREAYESLARNERRLLLFFDATEEAILGIDREGFCNFANDACLRLLGVGTYESIIGKLLHELFLYLPDNLYAEISERSIVNQSMADGHAFESEDGLLQLSSGESLFASLRCYPVFKDGVVSGAIIFLNDNSETRQLRRERNLLSEAVNQVPLLVVITDSDNFVQYANSGTERLVGFSKEEMLGQSLLRFKDLWLGQKNLFTKIEKELQKEGRWAGVVTISSKWGVPLALFTVISAVTDNDDRVVNFIAVSREISYEIALQNELVNSKKMEAIGRLSASFAHEFGNPLFGIRAVVKDLSERPGTSKEDKRLLELADRECEKMKEMVHEFKQSYFDSSKKDEKQCVSTVVKVVLKELSDLLESTNVTVSLELSELCLKPLVSENKLFLVVRSIVINGIESMSGAGGTLKISDRIKDQFLIVSVADTGTGIKKEHKELVFEPFFSTKREVEGTGLGLSVAYGTMKRLGGTLSFVSAEGQGSTFHIHIPFQNG